MDLFLKHLNQIKQMAVKTKSRHYNLYEVDELINAAYVKYDRAVTNNPSLIEEHFFNIKTFLYRVQMDMRDYIREESKSRINKRLEAKDLPVPKFQSISDYRSDGDFARGYHAYEHSTEEGYAQIEAKDYVDELREKSSLSDSEWAVIQGYFYDEKTLKEISTEAGLSEGRICIKKQKVLKKLLTCSENLL